jgi:hypothetical protein
MTAGLLSLGKVDSPRFAVIGALKQRAVSHVGILATPGMVENGQVVFVFHMANPITRLQLPGTMDAHAVGWIEDLSAEEQCNIQDWLDELKTSSSQIRYYAYPAAEIDRDKVTGRPIGRNFSCTGFVHSCFEEALRLTLVVSEAHLPEVGIDVLRQVWGELVERRGLRYLRGPGPWRVLLPSYLFHALTKTRAGMPHQPQHADPFFP